MSDTRVLVTGGKGKVGSALLPRLGLQHTIADLPEHDLTDPAALDRVLPGHDAIFHLAWGGEGAYGGGFAPEVNLVMVQNVYEAALRHGVQRVVMASSVHADPRMDELLQGVRAGVPAYGASKAFMEELGRRYAMAGLEVVAIRFGGVNTRNLPPEGDGTKFDVERRVWLAHSDGADLVRRALTEPMTERFATIYGVSNNSRPVFDTGNPFGWVPRHGASAPRTAALIAHPPAAPAVTPPAPGPGVQRH